VTARPEQRFPFFPISPNSATIVTMLMDLLAQFIVEFIRALLIDELSRRVRVRSWRQRQLRREQFYRMLRSGRGKRIARNFSTPDRKPVT
jgi:hypothetical protein